MKKKIIIALCVVALFIPTVIAIFYYSAAQKAPVTERSVESLVLTDLVGSDHVFSKASGEKEDKQMISFFISMNDSATQVASLPSQLVGEKSFKATYKSYNSDKIYKYYFSADPGEAYYTDASGKNFSISKSDAEAFLGMKYAESLFESAVEPVLTLADGSLIEPYAMDWEYKAPAGQFVRTSFNGTGDQSKVFPIAGGLNINFTNNPDYLNVKIIRDGEVKFDDVYEKLTPSVIGDKICSLDVVMTAKWYQDTAKEYYGEATYQFKANVSAPASFALGTTTIEQGEFVAITGKNVTDIANLSFTSEPSINYTPVFYRDGDYVEALIPISLDLEYSSSYTFTLMTQGQSQTLTLNVTERAKKATLTYDVTAALVNQTRTSATINAFKTALKPFSDKCEEARYFDGIFIEPLANRQIKTGFGRERKISVTGEVYTHTGVDYVVGAGDEVLATNAGKVVYVGEQVVSGRLVVIDHGLGLKSWYMHMDQINVAVGDMVQTGTVLGTVGNGGFTNGLNCHFELTINGIPVSPYKVNETGIVLVKD